MISFFLEERKEKQLNAIKQCVSVAVSKGEKKGGKERNNLKMNYKEQRNEANGDL